MARTTAAIAAITLTSCSLLTVQAPNPRARADRPPDCTAGDRLPIVVDGLAAVVTLPGVLFVSDEETTADNAIAVAATAAGVAFAASAIVGLRRERQCRHAWDVYATQQHHAASP